MSRSRRLPVSQEERVAKQIGKHLSDFTLDLEEVGRYLSLVLPFTIYARAMEVLESAQHQRDMKDSGAYHDKF